MTITINGSGTITGATTLASTVASPTMTTPTLTTPTMTGAIVSSMGSSVITSGTAQASTSGTSIDFTSIPSWVKRVTIVFNVMSTNGTSPPQIQIGSGSVATTGYACSNSVCVNGAVGAANFTSGFGIGVSTGNWAGTSVVSGAITLSLLSGNIWTCSGSVGSSAGVAIYNTAGGVTLSGTLDRVRITTVNGTDAFDAGSINILYE